MLMQVIFRSPKSQGRRKEVRQQQKLVQGSKKSDTQKREQELKRQSKEEDMKRQKLDLQQTIEILKQSLVRKQLHQPRNAVEAASFAKTLKEKEEKYNEFCDENYRTSKKLC